MSSYSELSKAFGNKQTYKYDGTLLCDGTKIVCTRGHWMLNQKTKQWTRNRTTPVVLAEWIEYKGKNYAIVYNRGNKCFASEALWRFNRTTVAYSRLGSSPLKYGEVGKPTGEQQISYRCQLIDTLVHSKVITHILIPTTFDGDSEFFKKL